MGAQKEKPRVYQIKRGADTPPAFYKDEGRPTMYIVDGPVPKEGELVTTIEVGGQSQLIKIGEDREPEGYVNIDPTRLCGEHIFDLALTPIVIVSPTEPPRVDGWLMSPRTTLDIRPREQQPPYAHVGVLPLSALAKVRELVQKAHDNGLGLDGVLLEIADVVGGVK